MTLSFPDFGDLVFLLALLFGSLIAIFETLERRREARRENLLLSEIAREYHMLRRLGEL